jgi:hypothetical protein
MSEVQVSFKDCIAAMYTRATVTGAALNKSEGKVPLRHRPCEPSVSNTRGRVGEYVTIRIARGVRKLLTVVFGNTCLKARL